MDHDNLLAEMESLRLRVAELEDTQIRLAGTEQALRDAEERFRLLYENAPLGYQSLDEDGRIVEVNQAWLETLGYSREEVIGHWFGDFLAPAYQEIFKADFSKSKAGEIHWTDFDMVRKDGSTVSMSLDGQISRDQSGRFKQTQCIIHDFTELRRSRQELKEKQGRLSLALDGASLGIWDWDLETGRAWWTERAFGMLGYEAKEFEPDLKNWKNLIHHDDWPSVSENLNLHIEGKEPLFVAEYRTMNKGGQWQWVQASGKVIEFGADGKPVRMAGVVVDVTDRKRAEDELRRLNRALRTVSECNQTLVRAPDEATLVANLCRILVEHGGYRMVSWIDFAEQDESKAVRSVVQAGFEEGYLNSANSTLANTERGCGPTGIAIRTGQPVITRNIPADPASAPWSEAVVQRGCLSSLALPLKRGDRVFGALNLYAADPAAFDAEEVRLLNDLADDLAYGISALRMHVERERAEEELRHSEERYRTLVEESFEGILVQKGAKIVFANSRLYEMLGYEKGELDGLDHWLVYHPDYHEITRERAQTSMRGEDAPSQYEVRLQRKDGSSFEGEIRARVIGLNGEPGVQVWVRDVSDRKQTEKRLRDSEQKYRELVELANSIILRWTCDGRITFLNDFGQKFFGYSAEEILGRHVVGTIVPMTDSSGRDLGPLMDQILADPKAFEQNVNENMRRNGERVWISWTNRIVVGEQGQVAEILSIGTDITERKRAQEALQQAHDELEHRVAERTAELAQAKERAEAADLLKSAFLATMSHELRTPLNSIIGFTGIILQGLAGPLNSEQTKQLEMVRGSARHLLSLINDVLDISKIEAGQLEVASEPFDLHASITKVLGIVAPLAEKKGLSLRAQIAPGLGEVLGDQRRVEQILFNLLNNAIKFTESGKVELNAELVFDFGSPGVRARQPDLRLCVSDTGIGIKPEDLATLFQPFRQIESGLTRSHEGTGLGLAICRRLADLMDGEIHVESMWEKGSTFSLTLPLKLRNQ
jgi:PAS domain S-box-containing protein